MTESRYDLDQISRHVIRVSDDLGHAYGESWMRVSGVIQRPAEGLPAPGFSDLAVELGRFPADPTQHAEAWRQEFERVLTARA